MRDDEPLNPDELLEILNAEERKRGRGQLKIFLGMAAGVGKTYAMLEAAQRAAKDKRRVVVASVETHGRAETADLLQGLELLPEREVPYKQITIKELDLDALLKCKPELAIVDELAHSNLSPKARHPKRWQDVRELLDAGIDVYTTLNIQHVESLKEVVEEITGITVRESVPDLIIDEAAAIELVDLTPGELLQRLKEGKVYLGSQGAIAAGNFFQADRLTALRQLVLRFAADKVDHDLHSMISTLKRAKGWKPRERLMVMVTSAAECGRLIRATRRLAFSFDAPWIAVHINTGARPLPEESEACAKNLAGARELGADIVVTDDPDLVMGLARIAKKRGVTQIVIGAPDRPTPWRLWRRSRFLTALSREVGGIDIHVVATPRTSIPPRKEKRKRSNYFSLVGYGIAMGAAGLVGLIGTLLLPLIGYKVVGLLFLLALLLISPAVTLGPILFAALLFSLLLLFFFAPHTLLLSEDIALVVLYFLTALITGWLTRRAESREEMLLKREASVEAIYEIVREIASAPTMAHLFKAIKSRLGSVLHGRCDIYVKKADGSLSFKQTSSLLKSESERAVATWVFQNGKEAGLSTSTLPLAKAIYLPLRGFRETVGVIAFAPEGAKPLHPEELSLLYTISRELALYLERHLAEEKERELAHLGHIERIHQNILQLISDEFHGPLLAICGAAKALEADPLIQQHPAHHTSLHELEISTDGLIHVVEKISIMAAISSGRLYPKKKLQDVNSLIESCCQNVTPRLKGHELKVDLPKGLPLISFDLALFKLLLGNLINNAVAYSPPGTPIELSVTTLEGSLVLSVADRGQGIPEEMIGRVFEKFYRLPGTTATGVGLGLAIAKAIAEMHGATIRAQNRPDGGARFLVFVPLE